MDDTRHDEAKQATRQAALDYHEFPKPGKLEIRATKPLANGRDLSRAYSPGVAEACLEIKADPATASRYTSRGNLVAVISNGTAVLGLGNIGALASKPVMEGKAVLFKKFANIDCFDIEVNEPDPVKLAEIVCALEPTFGAVNLEDIKAPDCFIVEQLCREKMNIPVFHDDQHGTAIVVGAAATNALIVAGKHFDQIKVVSTGGGAAGIACLEMLVKLGVRRENIWLCDLDGLVYHGRAEAMTPQKAAFAQGTAPATLADVIDGADLFLGLSGPGVLTQEMVRKMAPRPIIFALANPNPEIAPDLVREVVPDAIIATGRSDYPNQVNNVLCFPFIFRGALDVGATTINKEMELACIEGIAALNADAVLVVEAPDTGSRRSSITALEGMARHFDLRCARAITGFPSETEQEITLIYNPDRLTPRHDPRGNAVGKKGSSDAPRFDGVFRYDLDTDATPDLVRFSKPPLELAVETSRGGQFRMIGVHMKSKAPHGVSGAEFVRQSIENRRKHLAECIWLRQRVEGHLEAGESLIVLGDFNDGPGLDEYEKLFGHSGLEVVLGCDAPPEQRLTDPHAAMARGGRLGLHPTTARFWMAPKQHYFEALLDFIMVSADLAAREPVWRIWHPWNDPTCLATPELHQALLQASDHFPVTLDLPGM